jgi:hypothetical protein
VSKLDRIILRALLSGEVVFSQRLPTRFAKLGRLKLCRHSSGEWAVLICASATDYSLPLGFWADRAMKIASRYATPATDELTP